MHPCILSEQNHSPTFPTCNTSSRCPLSPRPLPSHGPPKEQKDWGFSCPLAKASARTSSPSQGHFFSHARSWDKVSSRQSLQNFKVKRSFHKNNPEAELLRDLAPKQARNLLLLNSTLQTPQSQLSHRLAPKKSCGTVFLLRPVLILPK